MRRRTTRRIQRLAKARRQVEPPLLRVERIAGLGADVTEHVPRLRHLAGPVGVEEHDVVRIHEVDGEKPWLPLRRQLLAAAAQPARAHRRRDAVVQVAAAVVGDDVADAEVVAEPVRLHLAREDLCRRAELVDGLELLGQVPLALVGGVVAGVAQEVAHGADVRREASDPREVGVVEHLRVLDVAPGVEDRTRRRAHAGVDPVVLERRSRADQPLVRRQPVVRRQLAGAKEPLLVGEDEQDVVRPAGRLGVRRAHLCVRRRGGLRGGADSGRQRADAQRLEQVAPARARLSIARRLH